jgi:hypothetical protein
MGSCPSKDVYSSYASYERLNEMLRFHASLLVDVPRLLLCGWSAGMRAISRREQSFLPIFHARDTILHVESASAREADSMRPRLDDLDFCARQANVAANALSGRSSTVHHRIRCSACRRDVAEMLPDMACTNSRCAVLGSQLTSQRITSPQMARFGNS